MSSDQHGPKMVTTNTGERMLQWFEYSHLPPELQAASAQFHRLAVWVTNNVVAGPERTVTLRKLLEAKDAGVRAYMRPGA